MKKIEPITKDADGNVVLDLDADEANANWVYAARLKRRVDAGDDEARKELEEMERIQLYAL